jgi:hypothetical protein
LSKLQIWVRVSLLSVFATQPLALGTKTFFTLHNFRNINHIYIGESKIVPYTDGLEYFNVADFFSRTDNIINRLNELLNLKLYKEPNEIR